MLDFVFSLIGTLLYPLFSVIFTCIFSLQQLFYSFAGVGYVTIGGQSISGGGSGAENDTGIIYYLFQQPIVTNMLLSIMLLALFLVIIFTVMAFIKNVYAAKQKGWREIVGNAIKGLGNFILIPVCCLLGVWLGNILLNAIDGATSSGGSSDMSRKLFIASAYNANEFRTGNSSVDDWEELKSFAVECGYSAADKITSGLSNEEYANIVDEIYGTTNVAIWNQISVGKWYQVWSINYLVLVAGGIFMLYVLGSLAFAMVRRLFILIILFIISPGVCALYPLDEGKAVGSWKSKFISEFLSVYGAVAGMNVFFSIMPLIDKIEMYGSVGNISGINTIIQIFILVTGLLCVKEVVGLISGFVGGDDAYSKGSGLMKQSLDTTKKYTKKTLGGAFRYAGVAKEGFSSGYKGGKNWFTGGLKGILSATGAMVKTGAKDAYNATSKEYIDEASKGFKKGSDSFKREKDVRQLERDAKAFDPTAPDAEFKAQQMRALAAKLGISEDIDKKLAKSNKMSLDDYRSNKQLTKEYASKEKAFNYADKDYNGFIADLKGVQAGTVTTDDFKTNHGIDLAEASSLSGIGVPELVSQILSGVKNSPDSMDVDRLVDEKGLSRADALKFAQSRKIVNDAIDLKLDKDNTLSEAGEALIDAAKALKKGYKEGADATGKIFTDAVVDGVESAVDKVLKSRDDTTRINVGDIKATFDPAVTTAIISSVDKLSKDNEKAAEEMKKMAKGLPSEISKAAAKADEKK